MSVAKGRGNAVRRTRWPTARFLDLPDRPQQARSWGEPVAAVRMHGATHQRPRERWAAERPLLGPLPGPERPACCRREDRTGGRAVAAGGRRWARRLLRPGPRMADRRRAQAAHDRSRRLRIAAAPKVLLIDECGVWPDDRPAATALLTLISARYARGSVLLTATTGFGEGGAVPT